MNWARSITGEWQLWLTAARDLAENPVAHYLRLISQRRRKRIPRWRRYLPLIGLAILIGLLVAYYLSTFWMPGGSLKEVIRYSWILALLIASLTMIVVSLRRIAVTTSDALEMLSATEHKSQSAVLDEMLAASSIDDRDVVAGILSIIVPRLAWASIVGAVLLWLWVATAHLFESAKLSREALSALVLAPLTFGSVAFSGVLGATVLALWIVSHGRGLRSAFGGSALGFCTAAGHFLYPPFIFIMLGANLWNAAFTGDPGSQLWYFVLFRLLMAGVVVAGYELLLSGALRGRRASLLGVFAAPLLLPAGVLLSYLTSFLADFRADFSGIMALTFSQAWGAVLVFNPLAVASNYCLGADSFDEPLWFEISYLLLIAQQLAMIAVGAHKARQAVTRWRQQPL